MAHLSEFAPKPIPKPKPIPQLYQLEMNETEAWGLYRLLNERGGCGNLYMAFKALGFTQASPLYPGPKLFE